MLLKKRNRMIEQKKLRGIRRKRNVLECKLRLMRNNPSKDILTKRQVMIVSGRQWVLSILRDY